MKICLLSILLLPFCSAEASSFSGCGSYFFKGKLIENHKGSNRIIYIVNEGSQSSMTFSISAKKDFMKISSFLNQPTSFKAKITKVMNGTIGSIEDIEEIKLRYPNPLIDTATGITKLSLFQCK